MNRLIDRIGDFLASKPGCLPMVAIALIVANFILQIYPGSRYWIAESNLLLHLGLLVGFIGFLIIRPLG